MNEIEVYLSEIKLALRKCKAEEYSERSVKNALELLGELCKLVPEKSAQDSLLTEMNALVEKRRAASIRERECRARGWTGVENADIHTAFPLVKNADIPKKTLYNIAVIESQKSCNDNAFLLYSPFLSELKYQTEQYARESGGDLRYIDCEQLVGEYRAEATQLLNALCKHAESASGEVVAYYNLPALARDEAAEQAFCYYLKKIRMQGKNCVQLLLSNDLEYAFELVYKKWISEFYADDDLLDSLYYGALNFVFISLPKFEFVKAQIGKAFGVAADDKKAEKLLKKEGVLLGYEGLDALLALSGGALDKALKEITAGKREAFERFAKLAGENISCVADEGWGYKTARKALVVQPHDPVLDPDFKMPRTAYDSIAGIDEIRENIEKILNTGGVSVPMKCVWALTYALDNGDTLNVTNLAKEEIKGTLSQRWELAYDALAQLMRIPRGELLFNIEDKEGVRGQCCDGGKTIRLHKNFIKTNDPDELKQAQQTFLHELYHALQHTAIAASQTGDTETLGYYLVHFGVNSHIAEWRDNFSRYRQPDGKGGFDDYHDQVVEAEARIFAADRMAEFANFNVPKLD